MLPIIQLLKSYLKSVSWKVNFNCYQVVVFQILAILPINQSEIIPIVWAFMTAKVSVLLMCTVREYRNLEEDEERSDLVQPYNHNVQEEENRDISTETQ